MDEPRKHQTRYRWAMAKQTGYGQNRGIIYNDFEGIEKKACGG